MGMGGIAPFEPYVCGLLSILSVGLLFPNCRLPFLIEQLQVPFRSPLVKIFEKVLRSKNEYAQFTPIFSESLLQIFTRKK